MPSPKHFLASSSLGKSPGTPLASNPPSSLTQEPPSHVGKQSPSLPVSPPRQRRRHLRGASHRFPRKQEADFQGGASGDKVDHPPATQATRFPQLPHRLQGTKGKVGLRQARMGAPLLLRKVASGPAPAHLSPSLLAPNLRGSRVGLPPALFSLPWASRGYC